MKRELEVKKWATLLQEQGHTSPLLDDNLLMWQTDVTLHHPRQRTLMMLER